MYLDKETSVKSFSVQNFLEKSSMYQNYLELFSLLGTVGLIDIWPNLNNRNSSNAVLQYLIGNSFCFLSLHVSVSCFKTPCCITSASSVVTLNLLVISYYHSTFDYNILTNVPSFAWGFQKMKRLISRSACARKNDNS